VPIARLHLETGARAGRYFYEGAAFRAAPEHSDRAEEFLQIGLELYTDQGDDAVAADVEIAALAWKAAVAGGREDLSLWLGDAALFSAFIDALDLAAPLAARLKRIAARPRLLQAELARAGSEPDADVGQGGALAAILAGLSEGQAGALLEEVWALAGVERVGGRSAAEIAQRLIRRAETRQAPALTPNQARAVESFLAIEDEPVAALAAVRGLARQTAALQAALDGWSRRLDLLAAAGAAPPPGGLRFAARLGHSFDYYDGMTFEVRSAALGAQRPVAVGGRYDSLPARLGGTAGVRAVGGMVRPWRAYAGGEA
jgi:ATP phosphoribosyltransferase regulatory subunit